MRNICSVWGTFSFNDIIRGGSKTAATSKMERFAIIINEWKPLTIVTKRSIVDVAAALDPPLIMLTEKWILSFYLQGLL